MTYIVTDTETNRIVYAGPSAMAVRKCNHFFEVQIWDDGVYVDVCYVCEFISNKVGV